MADKWADLMHDKDVAVCDVPFWTARATLGKSSRKRYFNVRKLIHDLDALGEGRPCVGRMFVISLTALAAAFDYHFNALDDDSNAMAKVYHNLLYA